MKGKRCRLNKPSLYMDRTAIFDLPTLGRSFRKITAVPSVYKEVHGKAFKIVLFK